MFAKIYFHPKDVSISAFREESDDIAYINKDLLTDWLREKATQNAIGEPKVYQALKAVIDKIESM